jgi:hypothetical protein
MHSIFPYAAPASGFPGNGVDDLNGGDFAGWEPVNAHLRACGDEDG